jgi:hypothetical protein
MLEKKLHEELMRHRAINKYAKKLVIEQEAPITPEEPAAPDAGLAPEPAAPDAAIAPDAGLPPAPDTEPAPLEPAAEEPIDSTEEIDITDLVNMTKSIKKDIEDNRVDHGNVLDKMDGVFTKLNDLESKLAEMDQVMSKIDQLGAKVEMMREKSPEEKLEMRSLDSYPFNQNPQQFFAQKQGEMRQTGKNEYVLTKNEVDNYSTDNIRGSFNPEQQEEDEFKF